MSQSQSDIFLRLKYVAYCKAKLPPESVGTEYDDFVQFCRFSLCTRTSTLYKDPIWDSYTDEEIITEYYAYRFLENQEEADEFLSKIDVPDLDNPLDDFAKWAEQQEAETKKELEAKYEENISFSPDKGT